MRETELLGLMWSLHCTPLLLSTGSRILRRLSAPQRTASAAMLHVNAAAGTFVTVNTQASRAWLLIVCCRRHECSSCRQSMHGTGGSYPIVNKAKQYDAYSQHAPSVPTISNASSVVPALPASSAPTVGRAACPPAAVGAAATTPPSDVFNMEHVGAGPGQPQAEGYRLRVRCAVVA